MLMIGFGNNVFSKVILSACVQIQSKWPEPEAVIRNGKPEVFKCQLRYIFYTRKSYV